MVFRRIFWFFFFDGVDGYVIAIEKSEVRKGHFHLHSFMSFVEPCIIAELGDYIRSFPVCEQLNIQACRSAKSCKRYVSKEDIKLISNCKVSDLYNHYRVYKWAMQTPYFRYNAPFVVEHRFCYRFLASAHANWRCSLKPAFSKFEPVG